MNRIQIEQNALNSGGNPFVGQNGSGYGGGWSNGGHHHGHGMNGGGSWGTNVSGQGGGFGGLVRQDNRVSGEEQWIQSQLNSGTLSPQQQQDLQSRLSRLQSRQANINGQLGTDLSHTQSYLQNLLNSGNLSSQQQADIQSRLQQIQNEQNSLSGGTNPFFHP